MTRRRPLVRLIASTLLLLSAVGIITTANAPGVGWALLIVSLVVLTSPATREGPPVSRSRPAEGRSSAGRGH